MKKFIVLQSGKSDEQTYWSIIQSILGDARKHSVIITKKPYNSNDYIEIPEKMQKVIDWHTSGNGKQKEHTIKSISQKRLNGCYKNTELNFGIYKGYELGIVYAFDPSYIGWCINNIKDFFINDLTDLEEYGIFGVHDSYQQYRDYGIPNPRYQLLMDYYKSIDELSKRINVLNSDFRFDSAIIELNQKKVGEDLISEE